MRTTFKRSSLVGLISVVAVPILVAPTFGQSVKGKVSVDVGAGVPGVSFSGVNDSGQAMEDFVITIGDGCGVDISEVEVPGFQDWDVDDDQRGASNDPASENDDRDSSPGKQTRVDRKGKGKEKNADGSKKKGQKDPGKPIPKKKAFKLEITFSGNTTGTCKLCIAPTNARGFQIATIQQLVTGGNGYLIHNDMIVGMGMGAGEINATGGIITGLIIHPQDGLVLSEAFQIDTESGDVLNVDSCFPGAPCVLNLSQPVAPGEALGFDVGFDLLNEGEWSMLVVEPIAMPVSSTPHHERSRR